MKQRAGQSVVEYSILIVVTALALTLIFSFLRAAMSHRVKAGADAFGHGLIFQP
jgi:hypothetical protein